MFPHIVEFLRVLRQEQLSDLLNITRSSGTAVEVSMECAQAT